MFLVTQPILNYTANIETLVNTSIIGDVQSSCTDCYSNENSHLEANTLSNSTVQSVSLSLNNGTVSDSNFISSNLSLATTITSSTFTESDIYGTNNIRLINNVLSDTDLLISGDSRRLTMRYNKLDTDSSVSAELLDISHNYWGSTNLETIAVQTGYSPDKDQNTHLYPILTSYDLYSGDWDNDGIPDYIDHDNDNDGYSDLQEDWESDPVYGAIFNPLDDTSFPDVNNDNDMDGIADEDDVDDDNDGVSDVDENTYGTDPFLADSDGDSVNDGDEISYKYNPLDKNNFPLMGSISGQVIDNSNSNTDGVVYIVGFEQQDDMMNDSSIQRINLTGVTVSAGTQLMIEKDTPVSFYDSVIAGTSENVVTIRSSGAGNGSFNLYNSQVSFANIKLALDWYINETSEVVYSDLSMNNGYGYSHGLIQNSFVSNSTYWSNYGEITQSYLTGENVSNLSNGVIKSSYVELTSSLSNYGLFESSYSSDSLSNNSSIRQSENGVISNSIVEGLYSYSANSTIKNSDIKFYYNNTSAMFFDNVFMQNASGSVYYDGFGTPIDQIGDGVAETLFELNGSTYIVDGINNPRSTPNFPDAAGAIASDVIEGIWNPENVGAWWDKSDPSLFPESAP
ncbi:hypothetical protein [Psychrosphaera algicola]|uniref:Uncharacterized protein n=1 Tax=Psychrosphaera algicola TaxID=3023714 RepID=A0ABT5FAZ7_9GAMM|nr:hypothetical protein [Psychrosphaera sp. G1-22]MDC2888721.1 hypothetical protein [Psychrosphaera sp. G1-22]